jgi:hypothetical protein
MNYYLRVKETAKDLKKEFKDISTSDALLIAAKIEQAELIANAIKDGLLVNSSQRPVALEAIAMQLGFTDSLGRTDVTEALMAINETLENRI